MSGLVKLRIEAEFEYDADMMHGVDAEGRRWFFEHILGDPEGLVVHSNEVGDEIGIIRNVKVRP